MALQIALLHYPSRILALLKFIRYSVVNTPQTSGPIVKDMQINLKKSLHYMVHPHKRKHAETPIILHVAVTGRVLPSCAHTLPDQSSVRERYERIFRRTWRKRF